MEQPTDCDKLLRLLVKMYENPEGVTYRGGFHKLLQKEGLKYYRTIPNVLTNHKFIKREGSRYHYINPIRPNIRMCGEVFKLAHKVAKEQHRRYKKSKKSDKIQHNTVVGDVKEEVQSKEEMIEKIDSKIAFHQLEVERLEDAKRILKQL